MHKFNISILFKFSPQQSAFIIICKIFSFLELFMLILRMLLTFCQSLPINLLQTLIVSNILSFCLSHHNIHHLFFLVWKLRHKKLCKCSGDIIFTQKLLYLCYWTIVCSEIQVLWFFLKTLRKDPISFRIFPVCRFLFNASN